MQNQQSAFDEGSSFVGEPGSSVRWIRKRALSPSEAPIEFYDLNEDWCSPGWTAADGASSMRHAYARWCTSLVVWWLECRWKGWRVEGFIDGISGWGERNVTGGTSIEFLIERAERLSEPSARAFIPMRHARWLESVSVMLERSRDMGKRGRVVATLDWGDGLRIDAVKTAMRLALHWAPSPARRLLARYVRFAGCEHRSESPSEAAREKWLGGMGEALADSWMALRVGAWADLAFHSQRAAAQDPYSLMAQTMVFLASSKIGDANLMALTARRLESLAWPGDPTWMWILLAAPDWFEEAGNGTSAGIFEPLDVALPLRAKQLVGALSRS